MGTQLKNEDCRWNKDKKGEAAQLCNKKKSAEDEKWT